MKPRRYRHIEPPLINIAPLVDVLLVLVCFFLLASASMTKLIPVDTPSAALPSAVEAVNRVLVAVQADGKLLLDGSPAPWDTVRARIRANSVVEVAAHKALPYAEVVAVVEKLQALGPAQLTLVVR